MKVTILPYDDGFGVFWKVVNEKNQIIDNGFDSTADAEMYCFDNNLSL